MPQYASRVVTIKLWPVSICITCAFVLYSRIVRPGLEVVCHMYLSTSPIPLESLAMPTALNLKLMCIGGSAREQT